MKTIRNINAAFHHFCKVAAEEVKLRDRYGFTKNVSTFGEAMNFFDSAEIRAAQSHIEEKAKPELIDRD